MKAKRLLLLGATGMVGSCALRLCVDDPGIDRVTVIGRRSVGLEHPKLREIIHRELSDYSAISEALMDQDVALFCLGVYTGSVSDDVFKEITVDYTIAFAAALHEASPQAAVCFLSGQGADQKEKSRIAFARYKGMAENALLKTGFSRIHIFRPGYIYPVTPRIEPNTTCRLMRILYPAIRLLYPNIGISSELLAGAMVKAGLSGAEQTVLENRDIREYVSQ